MSNSRIYSIYKHNNNKCLLINITIINFYFLTKNKREKNHIMLNFSVQPTSEWSIIKDVQLYCTTVPLLLNEGNDTLWGKMVSNNGGDIIWK